MTSELSVPSVLPPDCNFHIEMAISREDIAEDLIKL